MTFVPFFTFTFKWSWDILAVAIFTTNTVHNITFVDIWNKFYWNRFPFFRSLYKITYQYIWDHFHPMQIQDYIGNWTHPLNSCIDHYCRCQEIRHIRWYLFCQSTQVPEKNPKRVNISRKEIIYLIEVRFITLGQRSVKGGVPGLGQSSHFALLGSSELPQALPTNEQQHVVRGNMPSTGETPVPNL